MLLRDAVDSFERGLIGQGYSKNSVATYMRHLAHLKGRLGDKSVEEIRRADLSEFLYDVRLRDDGAEKSQRTINSIKTAVKSLFRSLDLDRNPADGMRIKRVRIQRDYLTQDEVVRLLEGVTYVRDNAILAVLCFLGLRRSELVDLKVGEVVGGSDLTIYGKGGVERSIPINRYLRGVLDSFLVWKEERGESLDPKAPLFVSRKGNPVSPHAVYNLVRKWSVKALGRECHPHTMRHSFASMLVAKNVHLATIQRLMGHTSIAMTETYLHISNELRVDAVERLCK